MWFDALLAAFEYLISVIPATVMGIVLMELLIGLGWIERLGFVTAPFMRFAHLREEVGISFLASFGSPTAGNSMVAELNKKGLIDKKETIIASLVNSFPSTFIIVRDLLPVLIILLGTTGLVYLGIVVGVGLLRTAITLILGRFLLSPKKPAIIERHAEKKKFGAAFRNALSFSLPPLRRIIPTMIIAAIIVFQLIDIGFFEAVSVYLKDFPALAYLPPQGLPVIAAWFASNIGAYTIAGGLLADGIMSSKEIVITLLVGRVLSSIMRLRFTIPYYTGIFSPKLGMQIMLLALLMQEGLTVIVIVLLAVFW
ncbi:MAG: nucleoside recognition domain-containing protein [Candidatus Methanoperedens sp.]|nr:nucleoside recognition domain-containing protein [Candidatus Methanoperedens sp.]